MKTMKMAAVTEAEGQIQGKNKKTNAMSHKVWVQRLNQKKDDIIDTIKKSQVRIQESTSRLNDEENFQRDVINENKGNFKANSEGLLMNNYMTERVRYNIKEVRKMLNEMKKKNDEIRKMNANYILSKGKEYIQLENCNNNTEDDNQLFLPKVEIKKEILPKNFQYIKDKYRSELMRAFMKYNPLIHYNNLTNILEKADPAIKEDIINLRKRIDADVKELNDPHYYKYQYQKYKKKREQLESAQANSTKRGAMRIKSASLEKKKDMNKKQKEKPELEMMRDCLAKIDASIDTKNFKRYIEECDAADEMPYEERMANYFPQFKKTEEILKNLHSQRMNLATEEKTRNIKSAVMRNNEDMLKFIKESKSNLIAAILENEKKL